MYTGSAASRQHRANSQPAAASIGTQTSAAGLDRFPLYLGGIWLLCAVLRKLDLDAALPLRSTMTWGFVVLTWMGGAAACLCKKLRRA